MKDSLELLEQIRERLEEASAKKIDQLADALKSMSAAQRPSFFAEIRSIFGEKVAAQVAKKAKVPVGKSARPWMEDTLEEAKEPAWIKKAKKGLSPEDYASHRHLLGKLKVAIKAIEDLERDTPIFQTPAEQKALAGFRKWLERYNYPIALVKKKKEDDILFL